MAHHQIFKQSFDPNIDFSGLCQLQIDEDFDIHSSINSILGNELVMNGEVMMKEDHDDDDKERKRKGTEMMTSTTCSSYSSPQRNPNKRRGRGKKGRGKEEEEEEEKDAGEVIHVRAKRGQATDSHSLAERVRRGKINERLRCLQDIVPGCYKTMSMAVMLDEIINYVQSLQNQVEFLSMKLTSASSFHDFNADADAIEAMQRANAFEAIKGANEELPSDSAQLPHNFAYYPQPHTTSGFIN